MFYTSTGYIAPGECLYGTTTYDMGLDVTLGNLDRIN